MNGIFAGFSLVCRANPAVALGLLLALCTAGSARADIATPEQKKACTPDVYRLCAGEIPNVRAITACLRRQKASLSEACRAVFEPWHTAVVMPVTTRAGFDPFDHWIGPKVPN
jgi:hypothetical protein